MLVSISAAIPARTEHRTSWSLTIPQGSKHTSSVYSGPLVPIRRIWAHIFLLFSYVNPEEQDSGCKFKLSPEAWNHALAPRLRHRGEEHQNCCPTTPGDYVGAPVGARPPPFCTNNQQVHAATAQALLITAGGHVMNHAICIRHSP